MDVDDDGVQLRGVPVAGPWLIRAVNPDDGSVRILCESDRDSTSAAAVPMPTSTTESAAKKRKM